MFMFSGSIHHGFSSVLAGSVVSPKSDVWRFASFRCEMSMDEAPRLPKLSPARNDSPTSRKALDQLDTILPYMRMSRLA